MFPTSKGKDKGKDEVRPITGHEGPEVEYRYSSTLSSTSGLDEGGGQRHAPAALPPRKTRYPLYRGLGGPIGPVWTGAENLAGVRIPVEDSIPRPSSP